MSKQGQWLEMMALVSDEMLDPVGISGLAEAGRALRERNAWADRTSLVLSNETESDAAVDVIRAFKQEMRA
jgi:hypothetical protein